MTDLEAANKALVLLGVAPVGSLNDDTQAARTVSRMIGPAKQAVLSEFAWSFALRLAALSPAGGTPPPGWSYSFTMPAGAENIIQVYRGRVTYEDGRHVRTHLTKLNFIVQGGLICTNEADCSVEYTYQNTSIETWSDAAVEAFVTRLASDCAAMLTGGQQNGMALLQKYQYLIGNARGRSAATEDIAPALNTHYIDVRW